MDQDTKQFKVRLPSRPDFRGMGDESYSLTVVKAYTEVLTGNRYTVKDLLCEIIEWAPRRGFKLSRQKLPAIPTNASVERIDLRLNQKQIDAIDFLRDQLAKQLVEMNVFDARGYYERYEVVRELIPQELARISKVFESKFLKNSPVNTSNPPMHGQPWRPSDDEFLAHTWSKNPALNAASIGLSMGRGEGAILARLVHLKICPDMDVAKTENAARHQ